MYADSFQNVFMAYCCDLPKKLTHLFHIYLLQEEVKHWPSNGNNTVSQLKWGGRKLDLDLTY